MAADERDILAANGAFYAAFAAGDYAAMDRLWADKLAVVCVHPGWPPVHGRDQIMATWKSVLKSPPQPPIRCYGAKVLTSGEVGVVVGFEAVGNIALVATNIFARENGVWRMIHHQAAVTESATPPASQVPDGASVH